MSADERAAEQRAPAEGNTGHPGHPAVAGVRDDLTADVLLALLRAIFPGDDTHYWVACLDTLGPVSAGLPTDLAGWSEGRAWGARAEVRWQPTDAERYSALYLGDGEALPEGFQPLAENLQALPSTEAEGFFLWGTRGANSQYWEPRLPRSLDYAGLGAMASEPRVPCRLLVGADGQVRFIRLAAPEDAG